MYNFRKSLRSLLIGAALVGGALTTSLAPPSALAGVKKGDQMMVEIAIRPLR